MDKEIKKQVIALASVAVIAGAIVGGTYLNKSLEIKKEKETQQTQQQETQKKLEEAQKQLEELSKKQEEQSKKPIGQAQQPIAIQQQAPAQASSQSTQKPKLPPRPVKKEVKCESSPYPRQPGTIYHSDLLCFAEAYEAEQDYQQRLREWEKMIESGWTP